MAVLILLLPIVPFQLFLKIVDYFASFSSMKKDFLPLYLASHFYAC